MTDRELFDLINRIYRFDAQPSEREIKSVAQALTCRYNQSNYITQKDLDEVVDRNLSNKTRLVCYCIDMTNTIIILEKIMEEMRKRTR
jgi:hypothetical protein